MAPGGQYRANRERGKSQFLSFLCEQKYLGQKYLTTKLDTGSRAYQGRGRFCSSGDRSRNALQRRTFNSNGMLKRGSRRCCDPFHERNVVNSKLTSSRGYLSWQLCFRQSLISRFAHRGPKPQAYTEKRSALKIECVIGRRKRTQFILAFRSNNCFVEKRSVGMGPALDTADNFLKARDQYENEKWPRISDEAWKVIAVVRSAAERDHPLAQQVLGDALTRSHSPWAHDADASAEVSTVFAERTGRRKG